MQTGQRQQKNASSQASAAGRRAEVRQDSAHQSLLSSGLTPHLNIQPKLTIGQTGDKHEQEADRVAEHVVSQPLQRTPSLDQPVPVKPQLQRPPAITPMIQQQDGDTVREENQFQEEEQVVQGHELQFQEDAASESEEVQGRVRLRTDDGILGPITMPIATAGHGTQFGRPATRGPPLLSVPRGATNARAPPLQFKYTDVQPETIQLFPAPLQLQLNEQSALSMAPFQEDAEVRPGLIQCRAPPTQARTEESESRLDRELRQSRGGGLPLPEKTRVRMESTIGADFSNVRVHTDANAAQMNKMLGSQAFATGNNIFFGSGKYDPENLDGQRLLAHELTHTVQQNASPRLQLNPVARPRAPPVQQSTAYDLQGGFIGDRLNEYARHVPGWELFTVIIGYNPLTEQDVSRTPQNFLRGFMGLVPGGTALYDKLNENGLIDDAFSWLNSQLSELDLSWSRLRNAIDAAWEEMDFIRWDPFAYNLRVLKRHLLPIWNNVKTFAGRVIDKTVELVRTTMLAPLVNFIRERTRAYPLLTVILGQDPVTGEQVDRSLYNIVSAFLMLTESGEEYLNKLNESGKLQELSDWLDAEIEKLDVSVETVTNAFSEAWDLLDLNAVLHPIDTFTRLYNIFSGPVIRLFNFVIAVALKVLGLIKDWLLGLLKTYAHRIPGYPLLTVILGQDPLTGEEVPRTAENFIRGFLSFVPGGMEKFNNLKESGAIDKAFAWLKKAIKKLGLIGAAFANAFSQIWQSFSINDLTDPIGAFERVVAIFTEPVQMLIDFAIEVGMKVLEFIFEGVLGPTGARVLAILKKARSTFIKIIKKPIEFVGHLIDAVMKGFRQFSGNILNHLRTGLIGWLTGTLGSAGIQLPERFDLKGIVSLVLQILGLTWPRIRQKLVRHLGERAVSYLETAFEIVRLLVTEGPGALWEKLIEYIGNLKDTIMESIRNWIIEKVVTLAVTKLASLLTPAGAVIQAIISIYNTIMFFIERINQILDLVESVVNSVARIASGKIQEAADFVELSMARTIPVIISFLARLIGLGGIGQKIQNVIKKVQAKVDNGVDRVVAWIVARGRSILNRLRGRGGTEADAVGDYQSILRERVPFSMNGRQHHLSFRNKGNGVEIFMSSPDANFLSQKITTAKQGLGDREELSSTQRTTISSKLDEYNAKARDLNAALGMMRNPNLASNPGALNAFKNCLSQAGVSVTDPTDVAAVRIAVLASVQTLATEIQTFGTIHNLTDLMFLDVRSAELEVGTYTDLLRVNSDYNDTQTDDAQKLTADHQPQQDLMKRIKTIVWADPDDETNREWLLEGTSIVGYSAPRGICMNMTRANHDQARAGVSTENAVKQSFSWMDMDKPSPVGRWFDLDGSVALEYKAKGATKAEAQNKIKHGMTRTLDADHAEVRRIYASRSADANAAVGRVAAANRGAWGAVFMKRDSTLNSNRLQSSFLIGVAGVRFEQEADRVADRIVSKSPAAATTAITPYQARQPQTRSNANRVPSITHSFANRLSSVKSGGEPLVDNTRSEMEYGIGADFSSVKVHTDASATQMSREMGAQAFTHENHIYFNQGRYAPETSTGKHLLAHELTHVVQQDNRIRRQPVEAPVTTPERAATEKKKLVLGGAPMPGLEPPVEGEIQSPAEVEQQAEAEAEAGIKKDKKTRGPGEKGKAQGGKAKQKPAGGGEKKEVAKKKEPDEKSLGEQQPAPALKPLKGGSSDGMLNDFMTSPASRIAASYPTLGTGVSEALKAEKKQEADSAPKLVAKAGKGAMSARPSPGEEKSAREATIEEKQPKPVTQQKVPEHKNLAKPLNNARNNKALDQSPSGSWISWFKDRVLSFMSGIRTKDDGVNTSAGKPPKAELKGDADPKRAETQRRDGDKQTGTEKDKVSAQIKANPGKERIQPAPVDETNEVKIEAAVPEVETEKQDDMADYVTMPLPENVRKKADQDMSPLLEKSLAKPKADVTKASDKRNSDKQAEVSKAKSEVSKFNKKADQDQQNIVATSRNDVASEQKKGLDEADQQIKKYRKEADKEQTTLRDSVKKRVKEDEGKAEAELKKAEQDAEKEKKKKEAEAAEKKKELKKEQKKKSWWDRVKDAVKSVVKAITKAIDGIFNALRKAVKFIIDTAKKAALALIELGRKFVVGLLNTFRKLLKSLVTNLIGKIFPELARKINKGIDKVVDKAIAGVNKVADALKKGVEALANALGKILDKILSVFQTALKAAVQIAGAVLTGDFAEAAKIAFYAACDILGINPKSVINFMEKAGESLGKIFKSPGTFFNNVAKGVKKGIDQFVANIKQHLLNGLIAWLTGAMGDVQITLPKKFDIKGIFSLVTQILGLTYDNIRAKVVKKLGPKGEKIVSTLEETFAFVKELVTKGPIALWERVKQNLSNLENLVMKGIRNVVTKEVVEAGVVWLISMLNPASALVKAIKMLYDLVMFFVKRWDQIVAFAKSIWNSVNALANGRIGAAANAVEQALARSIPVILGLLASLLSLGGIGKSVQKMIREIRKPIDNAVDKVIAWIVKQAKRLIKTGKGAVSKIFRWWKKKSTYTDAAGKGHKVYFTGEGKGARLTRASTTPVVFDKYVQNLEKFINADTSRKTKYGPKIPDIKDLQKKISETQYRINSKGNVTSKHFTEKEGQELQKNLDSLTKKLKSIPSPDPDTDMVARPRSKITPGPLHMSTPTPNMVAKGYDKPDKTKEGTGVVADPLTMTANQSGSKATYYSNLYRYLAKELNLNMVAGHILYHRLHGSGSDSKNIAPISGSDNRRMESRFETKAFNAVFNDNAVLHYEVTFTYGGSGTKETDRLPRSINVDVYKKLFKGKESPADRENPAKYDGREKDIHKGSWDLDIPSISAGATVADKKKALEAAIVNELAKNPKLKWRGATSAPGFTRIPHIRNNFDGLAEPDKAAIKTKFDLEKTRIKNTAKAALQAGLTNAAFLAGISSFLKSTVLTMEEVATGIRSFAGTTTSKGTVTRWRSSGMPSATQNKFLAKTTGEETEELPQTKGEMSEPGYQYEQGNFGEILETSLNK